MKVLFSPRHALHAPKRVMRLGAFSAGRDVPERAEQLLATVRAGGHVIVEAAEHGRAPVAAVHTPEYLDFLETAHREWTALPGASEEVLPSHFPVRGMVGGYPRSVVGRAGYHMHDQLAPIGPGTFDAALASANLAADAAARLLAGERVLYALCRPSGHHAYADMGGGATYLNNAAIAAQFLRQRMRRVAVIDIDVHHGNGTQGIFYGRDDVLFVSLHRDPVDYHPYTVGYAHERGEGVGLGYNLNLPLPAMAQDAAYLDALQIACRRIESFVPEALVVSLGFDAHAEDPSQGLALSFDAYRAIGERLARLGLPTALIQEGGYAVGNLGRCLTEFFSGFEGAA
ncbi:acetylpolyamine amidohydrolase [Pseudoroseomonas deserti]|uniref:Acetylpolyamine amidohydrolase n=1 Tax=Teichococcus deserti TaxID=1817963 RepID=A0A1V2H7N5_9PROT|nr:histone deacetylase family protein [Pseudoroseomonas deserti]ONG58140.1 acetylpolyamine amidohydrolase [Pseudoroseomonas deserti]